MSAVSCAYGISRKTGYKWLKRAREGQPLSDKNRRPHSQPSKAPVETEGAVIAVRKANPTWGGKMIQAVLKANGVDDVPSAKTCGSILKRYGCIDPEKARQHRPIQHFKREECNQLWQTDFKGYFLLADGARCYPLDIIDDHSRYCIRIVAKSAESGLKDCFIRAFEEFGLPDCVLSYNGAQFAGFRGGYTQFERFLMQLNINSRIQRL